MLRNQEAEAEWAWARPSPVRAVSVRPVKVAWWRPKHRNPARAAVMVSGWSVAHSLISHRIATILRTSKHFFGTPSDCGDRASDWPPTSSAELAA